MHTDAVLTWLNALCQMQIFSNARNNDKTGALQSTDQNSALSDNTTSIVLAKSQVQFCAKDSIWWLG